MEFINKYKKPLILGAWTLLGAVLGGVFAEGTSHGPFAPDEPEEAAPAGSNEPENVEPQSDDAEETA